jgi:ABC-type bacteriocin/lantibiotic exporter with double-glycine peptidase domain
MIERIPADMRLLVVAAGLSLLLCARAGVSVVREVQARRFLNRLRRGWTSRILEGFMGGPIARVRERRRGEALNEVVNEPLHASRVYKELLEAGVRFAAAAATIVVLALVSPSMTLFASLSAAALAALTWRRSRGYALKSGRSRIDLQARVLTIVTDVIGGMRQIRIHSLERTVLSDALDRLDGLEENLSRFRLASRLPVVVAEPLVGLLLVAALLAHRLLLGPDQAGAVGSVAVMLLGTQRLFVTLSDLLSLRLAVLAQAPSLRLVHKRLKHGVTLPDRESGPTPGPVSIGCLRFEGVGFSYSPTRNTIHDFSADFSKGTITLLSGESGAGKSTVCDLIMRLIEPSEGRILADGAAIEGISPGAWRRSIGYVSQEPFLFPATVRENITAGLRDTPLAEIVAAAREADAESFIVNLPQGWDTPIGDGGHPLSGGQGQRIALARALVRRPSLLLLDEATSALDAASEARIAASLASHRGERITVAVAHRGAITSVADRTVSLRRSRPAPKR